MSKAVERPPCPCVEQVVEALVGLLGGPEAGELAHGPQPAPVHRRVDPARVRELARAPDVGRRIGRQVIRRVERLDGLARDRREVGVALGARREALAEPALVVLRCRAGLGGHRRPRVRHGPAGEARSALRRSASPLPGAERTGRVRMLVGVPERRGVLARLNRLLVLSLVAVGAFSLGVSSRSGFSSTLRSARPRRPRLASRSRSDHPGVRDTPPDGVSASAGDAAARLEASRDVAPTPPTSPTAPTARRA